MYNSGTISSFRSPIAKPPIPSALATRSGRRVRSRRGRSAIRVTAAEGARVRWLPSRSSRVCSPAAWSTCGVRVGPRRPDRHGSRGSWSCMQWHGPRPPVHPSRTQPTAWNSSWCAGSLSPVKRVGTLTPSTASQVELVVVGEGATKRIVPCADHRGLEPGCAVQGRERLSSRKPVPSQSPVMVPETETTPILPTVE